MSDNNRYDALAKQYGEDIARIMVSLDEKAQKEKGMEHFIERYGKTGSDAINMQRQDETRRRTEGEDYIIKDYLAKWDNDERHVAFKKKQEQDKQKALQNEKFIDDLNNELKQEAELQAFIKEKFGDEALQRHLVNQKAKKFKLDD